MGEEPIRDREDRTPMCDSNHGQANILALATPELGTRLMSYHREVGLSDQQLSQVTDIARGWRERYIQFAEPILRLGNEVDAVLLERHVDLPAVNKLADERRDLIEQAERAFFETWEELRNVVNDEQYERSIAIYRREFAHMPHPVLGTSAWEAPLGVRADERMAEPVLS